METILPSRARTIPAIIAAAILLAGCPNAGMPSGGTISRFDLSASYGTSYSIQVWVPDGIAFGSKVKTLYVLDGDEAFGASALAASDLIAAGTVAPFLVVGIGYGSGTNERDRDYTPTYSAANGEGGGADAFLGFVTNGLAPRIEADYPALADRSARVIDGHSFGGLAVLEAFFKYSAAFSRFIASSPSLWWDGNVMFDSVASFLPASGSAQASRLFVSVGSHEGDGMDALFEVFAQRMSAAASPPIYFSSEIVPNKRHWDSRYVAMRDALPFVMAGAP